MKVFVEARRRGLLRVATAYLAVSWLTLEIGHTLFNIFELPHAGLQLIFALLAIGFPLALLGTWQGWFAPAFAGAEKEDHPTHAPNSHDGPWVAGIFAVVALIAIAIAIGVRFFGMGFTDAHVATRGRTHAATEVRDAASTAKPAPFAPPAHSVAVLAFVNMSGDPKDEYFSDGLAEELLETLVRIQDLHVAARTSSFAFKSMPIDIPTVGRRLNVGTVLEGSVRKVGDRVRITAQLIDTRNGFHKWSRTYDRKLTDIFALQTEIATAVASQLEIELFGGLQASRGNPLAFDAYLHGRQQRRAPTEASLRAAMMDFARAIALDPNYAPAYGQRGETAALLANDWVGNPTERERLFAAAHEDVNKAVALAPDSGQAYGSLGLVLLTTTFDFVAIDAAFRRSIALEPGNAELLTNYADFAGRLGRADAIDAAMRAVALSPLDADVRMALGIVLFYARRYDEARATMRAALAMDDNPRKHSWAGWNELAAGQTEAAIPLCEANRATWYSQTCLVIAYNRMHREAEANAELARMKMEQGDLLSAQYAQIEAQRGNAGTALQWLRKAMALHDAGLGEIKADPMLDPIRKLPEFAQIVEQLHLPP